MLTRKYLIRQSNRIFAIVLINALCAGWLPIRAQTKSTTLDVTITNLYDAFGKDTKGLKHDFGFSSVVEFRGKTILFDAGMNADIFESNTRSLNIDLKKIDVAILSHGHYDHIGGLDYLISVNPNVKIYLPNDFFSLGAPSKFPFREAEPEVAASLPKDTQYFRGNTAVEGMLHMSSGRFWKSDVEYITEVKEILPGITIVPTTANLMGTFIRYPPFEDSPQFIGMPELSVAFATEKGDIVISGCSHTTIEKIIQEIKSVRNSNIYLVVGGFHLIPYGRDYIEGLARRMREEYGVQSVAPAHCTGHLGFSIFQKEFGDDYKFFGLGERLEL
jgi:7,8-dihydropterin-6-yl-methyl-4-(beta-D-ribofuranosyl)aminobenzene 5'-phosphate synthase